MPMSEEKKKAASERMKAMHAKKKAEKKVEQPDFSHQPTEMTSRDEDIDLLKRQLAEVQAMLANQQPQMQSPQFNHRGGLVGRMDKFIIDPANYPDPCTRLSAEPRLQRFAFPINYELSFKIETTSYQTQDGVNTREPRFELELHKVVMDDETGEPTNGRFVVCKAIFHEDPQAAIVIARDNGIEVDQTNEKQFLDEMRYLRMRDWLLEAFYPKAAQPARQKKEMVVGNKLVEFFTVNSEDAQSPFASMNSSTKKL